VNAAHNRHLFTNVRKCSPTTLYGLNDGEKGIKCDTIGLKSLCCVQDSECLHQHKHQQQILTGFGNFGSIGGALPSMSSLQSVVSQVGVEASLQQSNQITLQCLQVVEISSVHQEEEKNQFERN
jgi:hypothetical protein